MRIKEIIEDIKNYQLRIQNAQKQIDKLDFGKYPHKNKNELVRKAAEEIRHNRRLIEYAHEGIILRIDGVI
jgi:hypothetical protein